MLSLEKIIFDEWDPEQLRLKELNSIDVLEEELSVEA